MKATAYIVLFRGVGGATQLPIAPLREALSEAGFENVSTYINSGNAVLSSSKSRTETLDTVARIAREKFGFEKDILMLSGAEWARAIRENPFPEAVDQPTTLHLFALQDVPPIPAIEALAARCAAHERIAVTGKLLYFHAPHGFGTSKLPPVIDRVLATVSTARNWRTVLALQERVETAG